MNGQVWVVTIVLLTWALYLYRRSVIQSFPYRTLQLDTFQPGDVVFMASQNLSFVNPMSYHAIYANLILQTPFYHVFLVLKNGMYAHVISQAYRPRYQQHCNDLYVGTIADFLNARQEYAPLYAVFRRPNNPVFFEPHLSALCGRHFPAIPVLAAGMVFSRIAQKHVHCNSYVGLLLEHMGLLTPPSAHPQRDYIPSNMIRLYLPRAGYNLVGYYKIE